MDKLTDFNDTSDVSDVAIEWVFQALGQKDWLPSDCRTYAYRGDADDRGYILAARLIQQYRSDLLADPVDALIDEWLELNGGLYPACTYSARHAEAKRLYLMGLEAGKKS